MVILNLKSRPDPPSSAESSSRLLAFASSAHASNSSFEQRVAEEPELPPVVGLEMGIAVVVTTGKWPLRYKKAPQRYLRQQRRTVNEKALRKDGKKKVNSEPLSEFLYLFLSSLGTGAH